jgi:hypothetical protein
MECTVSAVQVPGTLLSVAVGHPPTSAVCTLQ